VVIFIKGGLSVEYVAIYTYGAELFPSNIRGTACGLSIFGAKMVGAVSSPLIAFSRDTLHVNPMVGCGATVIFSILAMLILPETYNKTLE